ncbi:hypothetical protein K443DRAFT_631946 [Laccaria amethystina LaAM-08-1]|uniref:N-end aminoacyl transferase N-terminal domain-containing protein n=1 Tax=Laccaria amethystina LaAM-08-1 TaxID=1095629 RepID=A0A0C9XNN1_9AGAR|nr:hypothetical protein K443DRAFT_631946 [Laccaria amethystina LaAM-08-1]
MDLDEIKSIAIPVGTSASTCGYCSPPGQRSTEATNCRSTALEAIRISCTTFSEQVYQGMIDRGWRRSGKFSTLLVEAAGRNHKIISRDLLL